MNKTLVIFIAIILIFIVAMVVWQFLQKTSNNQPALNENQQQNKESVSESPEEEPQPAAEEKNLNPIANYEIKGMKVEILKEGTGGLAKTGDNVTVDYVGTLLDGTKFDSSIDKDKPFSFILGQNTVIKGWELGVLGMKVGEKRRLTIPPELGYGHQGVGGVIPPVSTLIFEINLLKIN